MSQRFASREHEALSEEAREEYLALGADLERAWHHEGATPESRKRILRALLVEVVANVEGDHIKLRLHWQGGDHTELTVRKNRTGRHRWTTDVETGDLVRELARLMPDRSIANFLNRAGKRLVPARRQPRAIRRAQPRRLVAEQQRQGFPKVARRQPPADTGTGSTSATFGERRM